jgi:hypothetical protein
MLNLVDFTKVMEIIESMRQYEIELAAFYGMCADLWREDQAFWENLASAELRHSENLHRIGEIIEKNKYGFDIGRPFNQIALNTAITGLRDNIKRISEGKLSGMAVLILARDMEQSVLESHYGELVKSNDIEYQTLLKEILSQTSDHKMMIQKKINGMK